MGPVSVQQELYPQSIDLNHGDFVLLSNLVDDLAILGINVSFLGQNTITVNALPSNLKVSNPEQLIRSFINSFKENIGNQSIDVHQKLAMSLAKASSIPYNRQLEPIEMQDLVDKLFACQHPNISPEGKPTISIISTEELDKRF
jgi:DNA mismatch repair protein MutL